MKKIIPLILIFSIGCFCNSCRYSPGTFEDLLTSIRNLFVETHSIEKDGLVGVDTFALPGDKEQIAASVLANIDTLWAQMRDTLMRHPELNFGKLYWSEDFLDDPGAGYTQFIAREDSYSQDIDSMWKRFKFLPDPPNKFYNTYTDLIIYNKDKLLCWAFVVIEQYKAGGNNVKYTPYYWSYSVIGKRKNINEPFKVFIRPAHPAWATEKDWVEALENDVLFSAGWTTEIRDVFEAETDKLPVLSDPKFFEKHPLFHKFDDSTYNFEWWNANFNGRRNNGKPEYYRYNYPY